MLNRKNVFNKKNNLKSKTTVAWTAYFLLKKKIFTNF